MMKPMVEPKKIIETIQKDLNLFGEWHNQFLYNTVYGLEEHNVREFLKKQGFDYDEG